MGKEPATGDKDQGSFEQRLEAARRRAGLEPQPPGNEVPRGANDSKALTLAMRLGVELVAAMAVAVAIGYGLDRLLHTAPWFMIAFVPIGAIAGFRNLMRALGPSKPSGD